ncbi:MAG: DUF559 domain-containing protein [Microbacterium sp.]|uniref:DUF559 domain-containing protein n=1 Tax=Microbacterium sp. TaxID=51671 RepID=UPI0039E47B2A
MLPPDSPAPIPAAYLRRRRRRGEAVPQRWRVYSRVELLAGGWTPKKLTVAVADGRLVRARNGEYLHPDADPDCVAACRTGGRLTCVSELARWGVFVLDATALHVCHERGDSRHRPLPREVRRHRTRHARRPREDASVDLVEAFADAVRCQRPRAAIATLDSGLHLGLIDRRDLDRIFALLPPRFVALRRLLDARAESGSESPVRLILRTIGCEFEVQVRIDSVGRVDFVVAGRLIVECDSRGFHGSWADRRRDLRRDQAAAALGYATYRPIAEDIFWHPDRVVAAIRGLLDLLLPEPR